MGMRSESSIMPIEKSYINNNHPFPDKIFDLTMLSKTYRSFIYAA